MKRITIIAYTILMVVSASARTDVRLAELTVLGMRTPLGIDSKPTFGWEVSTTERGWRQSAYQIVVTDERGCTVWNSGKVKSNRQTSIAYEGAALRSRTAYRWSVTVFDARGRRAGSGESQFETAFLDPSEWAARWIVRKGVDRIHPDYKNVPYYARQFTIPTGKKVRSARLYASALGVFTVKVNGHRVTENVLEPGETAYDRTVLYSTYDVTPALLSGHNTIVAQVAGGIFNVTPLDGRFSKVEIRNSGDSGLRAELFITYSDGSSDHVVTDGNWLTSPSATVGSNWWASESS